MPCVLTCSRANVLYVLPCQRALRAYVLTCQCVLRAHAPYALTCSHANVLCVPTFLRAITSNNKNKFSMKCFTQIFGTFSLSFYLWNKTVYEKCTTSKSVSKNIYFENSVVHLSIPLTRRKPLTGSMTNCTIKWFNFYLSRTLTVIFSRWEILFN